jgi:hypothetical protein
MSRCVLGQERCCGTCGWRGDVGTQAGKVALLCLNDEVMEVCPLVLGVARACERTCVGSSCRVAVESTANCRVRVLASF